MTKKLSLTWSDKVRAILQKDEEIEADDIWKALNLNNYRQLYRRLKKEGATISSIKKSLSSKNNKKNDKNNKKNDKNDTSESKIEENLSDVDTDNVDDSFQKMINYKRYATQMGEDIKYNTIQRHLKETDQLQQSKEEFEEDESFVNGIYRVFKSVKLIRKEAIHKRRNRLIEMGVINEH